MVTVIVIATMFLAILNIIGVVILFVGLAKIYQEVSDLRENIGEYVTIEAKGMIALCDALDKMAKDIKDIKERD